MSKILSKVILCDKNYNIITKINYGESIYNYFYNEDNLLIRKERTHYLNHVHDNGALFDHSSITKYDYDDNKNLISKYIEKTMTINDMRHKFLYEYEYDDKNRCIKSNSCGEINFYEYFDNECIVYNSNKLPIEHKYFDDKGRVIKIHNLLCNHVFLYEYISDDEYSFIKKNNYGKVIYSTKETRNHKNNTCKVITEYSNLERDLNTKEIYLGINKNILIYKDSVYTKIRSDIKKFGNLLRIEIYEEDVYYE